MDVPLGSDPFFVELELDYSGFRRHLAILSDSGHVRSHLLVSSCRRP